MRNAQRIRAYPSGIKAVSVASRHCGRLVGCSSVFLVCSRFIISQAYLQPRRKTRLAVPACTPASFCLAHLMHFR